MTPEFWFHPNVRSDLISLFREPEKCTRALSKISVLGLYAQQILNHGEVAPNTFEALRDAGVFRSGMPIAVEIGAVKPGGPSACDASDNTFNARAAVDRIELAGGLVSHLAIDEPLPSGLDPDLCNLPFEQVVEYTAGFIRELRPRVSSIGIIEQMPFSRADRIVLFMETLQQAGQSPSFLHLDADRLAIRNAGLTSPAEFRADIRSLDAHCRAWGIPFRVILWIPNIDPAKPAKFRDGVLAWHQQVMGMLPDGPSGGFVLQSWDAVAGHTLPKVAPETDLMSMTGVVLAL